MLVYLYLLAGYPLTPADKSRFWTAYAPTPFPIWCYSHVLLFNYLGDLGQILSFSIPLPVCRIVILSLEYPYIVYL